MLANFIHCFWLAVWALYLTLILMIIIATTQQTDSDINVWCAANTRANSTSHTTSNSASYSAPSTTPWTPKANTWSEMGGGRRLVLWRKRSRWDETNEGMTNTVCVCLLVEIKVINQCFIQRVEYLEFSTPKLKCPPSSFADFCHELVLLSHPKCIRFLTLPSKKNHDSVYETLLRLHNIVCKNAVHVVVTYT